MKKLSLICASLCAAFVFQTATAHAQSDALRRKVLERKKENQEKPKPTIPGTTPAPARVRPTIPGAKPAPPRGGRMCENRERILETNRNRLNAYEGELAGVNAEIAQLQQRLRELNEERTRVQSTVRALTTRVARDESDYKDKCGVTDTCSRYETIVTRLDTDTKRLEDDAAGVRREISGTQNSVANLRRSIEPLRSEYRRLQCNNLIPGQTQQRTIDRCAQIFSEWNRRQAELNNYNQRIPNLRHRYETILSRLSAMDNRANSAEAYLKRNCRTSRQLRTVDVVHRRRRNIVTVGNELQKLAKSIDDLRNLQITVTVR